MAIEVVFEKSIKNALIHRDVDTDRRREHILLICLAALFVLGLLFYGWQQYSWLQAGYEIENAQKQKEDLIERRNQLLLARESQARQERIDWIARHDLGMVDPAPGQTVMLSPDAPMTIPTSVDPNGPGLSARR